MTKLDSDLETLENAMRLVFQTMKRPHNWAHVSQRAGVAIDRPSAAILRILGASSGGRCRVHDLAAQLSIEAPSVTRKTQELEQAGYLRRVPDPQDRRAIDLSITPRGRVISKRLWQAQRQIIAEALEDWPVVKRQQFIELFERFSHDLAAASPAHASTKERADDGA